MQKLEDWRENQNQASSLQLRQNQRGNKIKKSKLAYWLNCNTLVTSFSSILSNLHNAWFRLPWLYVFSGISSVAHHNPHIKAIFVYLFMQELFDNKTHFFNFLSMNDKPRLCQLKVIPSSRSSTVQASLTTWIFSSVQENTIKEVEIP